MVVDKRLVKNKLGCEWATCVIQEFVNRGMLPTPLKNDNIKSCHLSVLGLPLLMRCNASSFHQKLRQQPVALSLGHRSAAVPGLQRNLRRRKGRVEMSSNQKSGVPWTPGREGGC